MILKNIDKVDVNDQNVHTQLKKIIKDLADGKEIEKEKLLFLLKTSSVNELVYLEELANEIREKYYQKKVYMRCLIEFTNYCSKNCNYCGIRNKNLEVSRYRYSKEEIIECCKEGYELGFRTFVLQGGEDPYFNDDRLVDIIKGIKEEFHDVALTLSVGERSKESYKNLYDAGCDRFLLRHETASKRLYEHLHPKPMSFENRMECLRNLKEWGFQTGCGFMVNSPSQTDEDLLEDFIFIQNFQPEMCGIGPYVCHSKTPFKGNENGTINQVRFCVALVRLLVPNALLPATTALATIDNSGREIVLKSGANVIMLNLSPKDTRKDYEIYEGKVSFGDEEAHGKYLVESKINEIGFEMDMEIGNVKGWNDVY
jgi:biotin synthase